MQQRQSTKQSRRAVGLDLTPGPERNSSSCSQPVEGYLTVQRGRIVHPFALVWAEE